MSIVHFHFKGFSIITHASKIIVDHSTPKPSVDVMVTPNETLTSTMKPSSTSVGVTVTSNITTTLQAGEAMHSPNQVVYVNVCEHDTESYWIVAGSLSIVIVTLLMAMLVMYSRIRSYQKQLMAAKYMTLVPVRPSCDHIYDVLARTRSRSAIKHVRPPNQLSNTHSHPGADSNNLPPTLREMMAKSFASVSMLPTVPRVSFSANKDAESDKIALAEEETGNDDMEDVSSKGTVKDKISRLQVPMRL